MWGGRMKGRQVVINKCYGGFGLSHQAVMRYAELKGIKLYPWVNDIYKEVYGDKATLDNPAIWPSYTTVPQEEYERIYEEESKKPAGVGRFVKSNEVFFSGRDIARDDADLVSIVKEMGEEANSRFAKLEVVEVPADVSYTIEEYDGIEWIAEEHRTWG